MKNIYFITAILLLTVSVSFGQKTNNAKSKTDSVQIQHGYFFVDKDGDGYNDNAPDHDGDGIPNGLDKDYTGPKLRWGRRGWINDSTSVFPGRGFGRRAMFFKRRAAIRKDTTSFYPFPGCPRFYNGNDF